MSDTEKLVQDIQECMSDENGFVFTMVRNGQYVHTALQTPKNVDSTNMAFQDVCELLRTDQTANQAFHVFVSFAVQAMAKVKAEKTGGSVV
jgi:hypothetical protein